MKNETPTTMDHTRSCPDLTPNSDERCTCGLEFRIQLQTEREMHNAWRKRAEEAELKLFRPFDPDADGANGRKTNGSGDWNSGGCRMFEPQITITDSQIHTGRKTFLFHYPGDVSERYGLIPDVSVSAALDKYIGVLGARFKRDHRSSDVLLPTADEIAECPIPEKPTAVVENRRADNFAKARTPGYVPLWEQLRGEIKTNGQMTKQAVIARLRCSDASIYQILHKHSEVFSYQCGVIDLIANAGPVVPVIEMQPTPCAAPVAKTEPELRAAAPTPALAAVCHRTWEEQLLDKFPVFDAAWPENVKVEWFGAFGALIAVKNDVRTQMGKIVIR